MLTYFDHGFIDAKTGGRLSKLGQCFMSVAEVEEYGNGFIAGGSGRTLEEARSMRRTQLARGERTRLTWDAIRFGYPGEKLPVSIARNI